MSEDAGGELLTRSIDTLANGEDLTIDDAAGVLGLIMEGEVSEVQISAFLKSRLGGKYPIPHAPMTLMLWPMNGTTASFR